MTDSREHAMHGDGREPLVPPPEGWLDETWLDRELPPGFTVAAGEAFVRDTTARVLEDQRRIREEAARVDELSIPRGLLDAYRPPEPSPSFLAETLQRWRAERSGQVDAEAAERALRRVLPEYRVPESSPDFVGKTLAALGSGRASRRAALITPLRRAATVLAAAALLLAGLLWWTTRQDGGGDRSPDDPQPRRVASPAFRGQLHFGAVMTSSGLRDRAFVPPEDGLLAFVRLADSEAGN